MLLQDRVVLVTGGSRGIGRAICLDMARAGATVALNYHKSTDAAAALHEELRALGLRSSLYQADVTSPEAVDRMITAIEKEHGRLDILVNNAGITHVNFLMMYPQEHWENLLATNLNSVFLCSRRALKPMVRNNYGRIINISSISAIRGLPGNVIYASTKAALLGFTRSLAQEVGKFNILVNCVLPGLVDTDMTNNLDQDYVARLIDQVPLKRIGKPEEIAPLVTFLASEQAAYITGQSFVIDGGLTA